MGLYDRPHEVAVHGETRPVIPYHTILSSNILEEIYEKRTTKALINISVGIRTGYLRNTISEMLQFGPICLGESEEKNENHGEHNQFQSLDLNPVSLRYEIGLLRSMAVM
jgi:hypothetical protein